MHGKDIKLISVELQKTEMYYFLNNNMFNGKKKTKQTLISFYSYVLIKQFAKGSISIFFFFKDFKYIHRVKSFFQYFHLKKKGGAERNKIKTSKP